MNLIRVMPAEERKMKLYLKHLRNIHPLIHCITNYVTVNDCANLLLACGASPIMADEPAEAEEITAICSGLVLNIGTLNMRTVEAMKLAGLKAHALHHPVVLDPVGAGASHLRTRTALQLLAEVKPPILRCNVSELKMLMNAGTVSRGVDAALNDRVTGENLTGSAQTVAGFARENNCVTAVSGAIDLVAAPDGRVAAIRNGTPLMELVTGSGCMLSALTAAFAAVLPDTPFEAAVAAFCTMGIAGETASEKLLPDEGNAAFRNKMIDALFRAEDDIWERKIRCEML